MSKVYKERTIIILRKPSSEGWLNNSNKVLEQLSKDIEKLVIDEYEKDLIIDELKKRLKKIDDINNKKYRDKEIRDCCFIKDAEDEAKHNANRYWLDRNLQ